MRHKYEIRTEEDSRLVMTTFANEGEDLPAFEAAIRDTLNEEYILVYAGEVGNGSPNIPA